MHDSQVKQFLTIVKHMSINKASQELFISPSALSMALSRTESELGINLFYRDGKKLILSQAGQALLEQFKILDADRDRLFELARQQKENSDKHINVAFCDNAVVYHAMAFSNYFDSYGEKPVNCMLLDRMRSLQMLMAGDVDLSISYPPFDVPDISCVSLMSTDIVAVAAKGHPLARQESISPKELENEDIYLRKGHFMDFCIQLFEHRNIKPHYIKVQGLPAYWRQAQEGLETGRFLSLCERPYFETVFGTGYTALTIKDSGFVEHRALSWLSSSHVQYKYKSLLDYITQSYSQLYSYNLSLEQLNRSYYMK